MLSKIMYIPLFILMVFSTSCTCTHYQSPVDINSKPEAVKREFKELTLENNLNVLLISDPDLKQSAAAMNVNVGFGEDPEDQAGMAHFLEHMLFLGTKKYPDEGEYGQYINAYQGSNNAYTTFDNTNYFFVINHDGFEGGLDRFAQFFIAPLFTAKFVDREKNAVNNEFQKNKQHDGWRRYHLLKLSYEQNHPATKFGTGNSSTLKTITREDLMAWHKKYYSANNMSLVLMGSDSIDQLKKMAQDHFTSVPNYKAPKLSYSTKLLAENRKPSITHIIPVKDDRSLNISFSLPPQIDNFKDKSYSILSDMLSAEHPGGLAYTLKENDFATSVYAYPENQAHQYTLTIGIQLTESGEQNYKEVIKSVFAYINHLKSQDFPEAYFYEQKALAETYYVYPKFQEGGTYAAKMASFMKDYGSKDLLKKIYLFEEKSPENYQYLLSMLDLENAIIQFTHKGFKHNKTEAIYGTEFMTEVLEPAFIDSLTKAKGEFRLPQKNPYIPSDLSLIAQKQSSAKELLNGPGSYLWFQGDNSLGLPRASFTGQLTTPVASESTKNFILNEIYVNVLNQSLATWSEQVLLAGIDASFDSNYAGIEMYFDGFSEKMPKAISDFLSQWQNLVIDPRIFENQKEEYIRTLKNATYSSAYQQAMTKLRAEVNTFRPYPPEHIKIAEEMAVIDLEEYHQSFVDSVVLRGAAHGNLTEKDMLASLSSLKRDIETSLSFLEKAYIDLEKSSTKLSMTSKDNNFAWTKVLSTGQRQPQDEVFTMILSNLLSDKYFTDLRTRQQLGYVVSSFTYRDLKNVGIQFLIQSSNYPGKELSKRTQDWLKGEYERLLNLDEKSFQRAKRSLLEIIRKPFKTSDEFSNQIYFEQFAVKTPNYRSIMIEQAESMTLKRFKDRLKAHIKKGQGNLSIYINKSES